MWDEIPLRQACRAGRLDGSTRYTPAEWDRPGLEGVIGLTLMDGWIAVLGPPTPLAEPCADESR